MRWLDLEELGDPPCKDDVWLESIGSGARMINFEGVCQEIESRLDRLDASPARTHNPRRSPHGGENVANMMTKLPYKWSIFEIRYSDNIVKINNQSIHITDYAALLIFDAILRRKGELITSKEIQDQVPGAHGRIDQRLRRKLPKELRYWILGTHGKGGGYRLKPPQAAPRRRGKKERNERKSERNCS
jgi:hypothetical protein